MNDVIKVKYSVRTDKVGSKCSDVVEFEREDWESMTEEEREEEMKQHAFDEIEWNYVVVEDE